MSVIQQEPSKAVAPPRPISVTVQVTLTALAIPEEGGGYSIIVPALPGCVSQSDDIEGAGGNIKEAAEGWLAATHDRNAAEALRKATDPFPSKPRP